MATLRRTRYAFFYLEDDYIGDVGALLRGESPAERGEARVMALALLTAERYRLASHEFRMLMSLPASDWIDGDGLDAEAVRSLTDKGLLLSDAEDSRLSALR